MSKFSDLRVMKRAAAAILGLPDRLRQPERHALVRVRLSEMALPRTLLVVCAGNVCRSPYLEAVLRRELPHIRIASAGFVGFDRGVPEHALKAAARRGVDLSKFRSRVLELQRARTADLIVVMDQRQARYLNELAGIPRRRIIIAGDLDPTVSSSREIEDPWQQSADVFESTFDRLDRCAATLVAQLRSAASPPITARSSPLHTPTPTAGTEFLPQPTV